MAKIMLVEDDNSLREIYEARLAAEGYTVVSAKDGEEALATALKEHPDLIIADVMMPKVSGFDMLDILRSTPETKHTRIIMLTALSQAEDKVRAEKLGADRYLVKSQVTLEDVTREAREILEELESQAAATVAKVEGNAPTEAPAEAATEAETKAEAKPVPTTTVEKSDTTPPPTPAPVVTKPSQPKKDKDTAPEPVPTPSPTPTITSIPVAAPDDDTNDKPVNDQAKANDKLAAAAKALSTSEGVEKAEVKEQVDEFIASNPTLSSSPEPNDTATAAVESLTKSEVGKAKTSQEKKKQPVLDKDSQGGRSYVAANQSQDQPAGSTNSGSLEHTRTIQPTPDSERAASKPDLNALLAKEVAIEGQDNPPVDTVITPDNSGESPPTA